MGLAIKEFTAAGVGIVDELVRCSEVVTFGGNTYYRGYLAATVNENIYGASSANYGVWTLANKGGTRQTVQLRGLPASAGAVAIDTRNGYLYATVAGDFYVCYLAHCPIRHNLTSPLAIGIDWVLEAGSAFTIARVKAPVFMKFGYAMIDIEGAFPSAPATLTLSNGTETQALTVSATEAATAIEFDVPFKVHAGEVLTLSTLDGKGAAGLRVWLVDV